MKKWEIMKQCGALVGLKFKAAPDSETPDMEFKITRKGLKDDNGFPAVEITYADGEKEIAAIDCIDDGVKNRGLIVL